MPNKTSLEDHFRYLFLSLDLFMVALLSSSFIKGAWLPLIVFDFVDVCFSKTSEKNSVDLKYELSDL